MNCINKAVLLGNVGRDPEIRSTADGKPIAQFSLATSDVWSSPSGERQTRTEWHRVVVFNEHLVSIVERFLKKGQRVYIEGQIRSRKWVDQNGQENVIREIVLGRYRGEIVLLNNNGDRHGDAASTPDSTHPSSTDNSNEADIPAADTISDDIPF